MALKKFWFLKCDHVCGNQAFGHAIDIGVQACIVSMVYLDQVGILNFGFLPEREPESS